MSNFCCSVDSKITVDELTTFLKKVDHYFYGTLSVNCKQPSLKIWAQKLLTSAYFITARNRDGEIVGCIILYMNGVGDFVHVNILAVLEEYQNMHIASNLFNVLFDYAKKNNRKGISLDCRTANEKAQNFYRKQGLVLSSKESIGELYQRLEIVF